MGFDLYGENPKMRKPADKFPVYGKYVDMGFPEKQKVFKKDEALQSMYYKEMSEYEEANPGFYFRNNCWWWRPLWNYVCENCQDFLDDDDCEAGGYNDGKIINQRKAGKIAKRLNFMLDEGIVKEHEVMHEAERLAAKENNKGKEIDDEGYMWGASYPFCEDNVREFANFCAESGGFSIC